MRCTLSFDIVLIALVVGLVRDAAAKMLRKEHQKNLLARPPAQCYLTAPFRTAMYNGMWSYMNQDMMGSTIHQLSNASPKFTNTPGIADFDCIKGDDQCHHPCTGADSKPCWPKQFYGTICFKGDPDKGGHYLYIGPYGHQYGSYENGLLIRDDDDGICHGVAMCAFLSVGLGDNRFALDWHPRGLDHRNLPLLDTPITVHTLPRFKANYFKILSLYQHVLYNKIWKNALKIHFPGTESQTAANRALATVTEYITTEYGRGPRLYKRYDAGGCWVEDGKKGNYLS